MICSRDQGEDGGRRVSLRIEDHGDSAVARMLHNLE